VTQSTDPIDTSTQIGEATDQIVISTINVMNVMDLSHSLCCKSGHHECRSGADVWRHDGGTDQVVTPTHDGMMPVDGDVGTEFSQFLDVPEATRIQVLRDDSCSVSGREHRNK
jgi:hypothetical protein